jgi:hypothetical protein
MPVPDFGGCAWPVDTACFTEEWETFSPEVQERSIALASSTLHRLTGYRVTNCPITVRPCTPRAACGYGNGPGDFYFYGRTNFYPNNWGGVWSNSCGCRDNQCGHTAGAQIELPAPVGRVDQVKVNGAVVPTTAYRVDNGNLLVRTDGGSWPLTQDLRLADTQPNTFSVTYLNGYPVDSLGAYAVGVLAMEYGRACVGNACRLPSGVTMVARQGVTMEIQSGAFPNGLTGIQEVDTYLGLWNPGALRRGPTVYSPDQRRPRITTHGAGA